MSQSSIPLIYLVPTGDRISGIRTYGETLLELLPSVRLLILNIETNGLQKRGERTYVLDWRLSHAPPAVAAACRQIAQDAGWTRALVAPNIEDTPYDAARLLAAGSDAYSWRILPICHSDSPEQYRHIVALGDAAPLAVAVSETIAARLKEKRSGATVSAIYAPSPLRRFDAGTRKPTIGRLTVCYMGRLEEEQKRVSLLPQLAALLARQQVDVNWLIIGDGPERLALEAAFAKLGTGCAARFLGALDPVSVPGALAQADIFVLVSRYEGAPLALLEAMQAGLVPVVTRCSSSIDQLAVTNLCGFSAPIDNLEKLASAIAALDADRAMLARFSVAARIRVRQEHSQRRFLKAFRGAAACALSTSAPQINEPSDAERFLQRLSRRIEERPQRELGIYGAGSLGRRLLDLALDAGKHVVAMADRDPFLAGRSYRGIPILNANEVRHFPELRWIVASRSSGAEIRSWLQAALRTGDRQRTASIIYDEDLAEPTDQSSR